MNKQKGCLLKNQYKKLIIPMGFDSENDLPDLVTRINQAFNKKDIYLEVEGNELLLYLNQIDLTKLKEIQNTQNEAVFREIIAKISSIKSYGIKGKKRIYVDYNKERKVKNRKQKEENRSKFYYAQDHSFKKTNNEFPEEFKDQILCGDSLKILQRLPDNCIDLVFTSPPYNFGLEYEGQKDEHFWEEYFRKLFDIFQEAIRTLKFGGRFIVNIQPLFSDYIPTHHFISNYFIQQKLIWKGEILWEKNNYNCKYTAWGSWKSPSNPYLKYTWEFIEIFCKGDMKKTGERDNIDISAEEFKKWVIAKWSIAPERKMKKWEHPAMFPEELVMRVLKLFSYKDDVILDPFNGVGTTTAVAKQLERNYFGIDISEDYCKKAVQRTESTIIQASLF